MRKKKKMIIVGSCILILIVIYAFLCIFEGHVFVKQANYDVTIYGEPPLTGKVYRMRGGELMLGIYHQNGTGFYEGYVLDLVNRIAAPLNSPCIPRDFFGYGYVSNWIYDSHPTAEELKLDIEADGDNLILLIDGASEEARELEHCSENLTLYQRKILLSRK